jgi:hypothetical protein
MSSDSGPVRVNNGLWNRIEKFYIVLQQTMITCHQWNVTSAGANSAGPTLLGFKEATEVNCKTCSIECNIYLKGMARVKIMRHLIADIEMDSNSFTWSLVMNVASVNMEAPESSWLLCSEVSDTQALDIRWVIKLYNQAHGNVTRCRF